MGFFNKYKNASQVHDACFTGDCGRLSDLLSIGSSVLGSGDDGNTLMHLVVMGTSSYPNRPLSHFAACAILLAEARAEVSKVNEYGMTARDFACSKTDPRNRFMAQILELLEAGRIGDAKRLVAGIL